MGKAWVYVLLILVVFSFDQLTKRYLLYNIGLGNTSPFIPGIISFTVVQNTGGAFSIFSSYPGIFKLIGILNGLIFSYLLFSKRILLNQVSKIGCAFILGGSLGNLIDRILNGAVIDFLDLELFTFAVFNLADVFIDIGIVLVILGLWRTQKQKLEH